MTPEMAPEHVLLAGIVGSTAYGLAGPGSDIDRLGVFAAPTEDLVGLTQPEDTISSTRPDVTFHEAAKFASLLLKCNPTVSELLWLPDDLYEQRTPLGDALIGIRGSLLSRRHVRSAYLGYATQQFKRFANRGDGSFSADTRKRTAKHARHLARLIWQGVELYGAGTLTVRLDNPQWYLDFGEKVAAGDIDAAQHQLAIAEERFRDIRSPLPEQPDTAAAEAWLQEVRWTFYSRREAATEPEARADERARAAREILAHKVPCSDHPQPGGDAVRCLICSRNAALHKAARVAFGLPWPARLPEVADNDQS